MIRRAHESAGLDDFCLCCLDLDGDLREGGWFTPLGFMLLAPSAFFIIGGMIWLIRSLRPDQVEANAYPVAPPAEEARS